MKSDIDAIKNYVKGKLNKSYLNFQCEYEGDEYLILKVRVSSGVSQSVEMELSKIDSPLDKNLESVSQEGFKNFMSEALRTEREKLSGKIQTDIDAVMDQVISKSWTPGLSLTRKLYKANSVIRCFSCHGKGQSDCSSCVGVGRVSCSQCGGSQSMRCRSCSGGYSRCGACHGSGSLSQVEDIRDHTGQYIGHRTVNYPCSSCGSRGSTMCYSCNGSSQVACSYCSDGKMACQSCGGGGSITCTLCGGLCKVNQIGYIKEELKTLECVITERSNENWCDILAPIIKKEKLFASANEISRMDCVVREDGLFDIQFEVSYCIKKYLVKLPAGVGVDQEFKFLLAGASKVVFDLDGFVLSRIEESLLLPDKMLSSSNNPLNWLSFNYLRQIKPLLNIGEAKKYMVNSIAKSKNKKSDESTERDFDSGVDWAAQTQKISFVIRKTFLLKFLLYQVLFLLIWYGLAHYRVYQSVVASEFVFFTDNPIFFIKDYDFYAIDKLIPLDGLVLMFLVPVVLVFVEYSLLMVGSFIAFKYMLRGQLAYYGAAVLISALAVGISGLVIKKSAENSILYNGKFTWVFDKYVDTSGQTSFLSFLEENPFECGPKITETRDGKIPLYLLPLNSETYYGVLKKTGEKYNIGMQLPPGFYEIEMGKTSRKTKVYTINLSPENYCMKVYL